MSEKTIINKIKALLPADRYPLLQESAIKSPQSFQIDSRVIVAPRVKTQVLELTRKLAAIREKAAGRA